LPGGATIRPAGVAYFNLVWSDEVLWGMLESFLAGLVLVLILLVAQTRSLLWGVLTFLPLLFTIALIYGVVGLIGKDFDMPVAVLSTLSLGMAIDFAIHFVGRFQQRYREHPDLREALIWTVARPGRGILFNAILFALGFAVMLFADLTPYITVGAFMAAIMLLSALMSVIYLPGLIHLFRRVLLKGGTI
jgi:predicted RND superfamily exporter protein